MNDNFDLKKFLKENKSLENLNPIIKKSIKNKPITENKLRDKIKETILNELNNEDEFEDEDDYKEYFFDIDTPEDELEEAKKKDKEEVEDVEVTATTEEEPVDDVPEDGGLESIAAGLEGNESELMDHLMSALKISKGMGNEKLETQIGNTLKFFVSEYIGGGNE